CQPTLAVRAATSRNGATIPREDGKTGNGLQNSEPTRALGAAHCTTVAWDTSDRLSAKRLPDQAGRPRGGKPDRSDDHRKSAHSRARARRPIVSLGARAGFECTRHSHDYSLRARFL